MSARPASRPRVDGTLPLVAVVCSVPLIYEALRDPLESFAEVHSFPASTGTEGLLRSLRPDAVVVDRDADADEAAALSAELGLAVVHVSLKDEQVRVLEQGEWHAAEAATAEVVRDAIAGRIFGRGRA